MAILSQASGIILLALGFGFVIFWHELGHFAAAKAVGIKVEQFAVGFGRAIFSWRKGIGFATGNMKEKVELAISAERQKSQAAIVKNAASELAAQPVETDEQIFTRLGLGETEYRLNWLPLGGYVKMLGQDDLDPNAKSEDPRSFNNKSIGARMIVVSAGVLMNIVLAMIGFAIVFRIGFDAPPAVIGSIIQGSPAQRAGLQVGDRIASMDGTYQYDFTKLAPNVALAGENRQVKLNVQKYDGSYFDTVITPERQPGSGKGFLEMGVGQPMDLVGPADSPEVQELFKQTNLYDGQALALKPGETIIAVNHVPLEKTDSAEKIAADPSIRDRNFAAKRMNLHTLDQAIQSSHGKPVAITVINTASGAERTFDVLPAFQPPFDGHSLRLAGMAMRSVIQTIDLSSPLVNKLMPGDIVSEISIANAASPTVTTPSIEQLKEVLNNAGDHEEMVNLTVLRDGKPITFDHVTTIMLPNHKSGLNVGLDMDARSPIVGDVAKDSAAYRAGIPRGSTITKINDTPISNWFDIRDALGALSEGQTAKVYVTGVDQPFTLPGLTAEELAAIHYIRYDHSMQIQTMSMPRQTSNPLKAAAWGVTETKDMLLQFYVSLHRMFDGSVPVSGMMGPVGIFRAGTGFAKKGHVWLLWFLSMISANLAVVNFLPIPIVDGGLFTFLIIEKLRGKPLSERAHTVAQVVGLTLLGFVLVFATWQDIFR